MVIPEIKIDISADDYARLVVEPLENGFGATLGNSLRRVLLSSLPGAAITWVKLNQVQHEFTPIPYVKEDTIEFLLNVKELRLRPLSDRPGRLFLDVAGKGVVSAADIKPSSDFEIANPELVLATMDSDDASLTVEFNVEHGKGYEPSTLGNGLPIGVIPVDAIFTPVKKVNYQVEHTRVEQRTNFDRLILEVWTDGAMNPLDAISRSAEILIEQFSFFRAIVQGIQRVPEKQLLPAAVGLPPDKLDITIDELGLSVRAYNALKRSNLLKVGDIISKSHDELLQIRNFGSKSLMELAEKLSSLGIGAFSEAIRAREDGTEEDDEDS
ncbi:MAG: DNA-directed RNA polymerase subunit alpha [Dehalococcoidia bacterium]|nr:DNA-directed RNA polymerase subunit alpha [Dehalococcoidia bacterium]